MHPSLFAKFAADAPIDHAEAFSQQAWRESHYPPHQATLCCALTSFWLEEKLCQRAPLTQLASPDDALLFRLASAQELSYYPAFPDHYWNVHARRH